MISFQIQDIKDFMNKLLLSQTFDAFLVVQGSVVTYNTFHIDGHLHPDFYTKEEQEELRLSERRFSRWQELRPFCFELIKGKRNSSRFSVYLSAFSVEYRKAPFPNLGTGIFPRRRQWSASEYPL